MQGGGALIAGRYRVTRRLGSGAMGVVWLAHDEQLRRDVALKQLVSQDFADGGEAGRRAIREGRIAARVHHPNAVAIHDVTSHDGRPVLVMEYFPSRSLAAVLAEHGPLSDEQAARVGAQCAAALAAAHAAGIVHRDVKPANILVGDDGTAKITDFGISRAEGDVVVTRTGILAGTPAYLAPEVAQGRPATARSDVFALGATLYAALEGRPPFGEGANTIALLHRVAAGRFDPPTRSGPVADVVARLMRTDPAARPVMRWAHDALSAAPTTSTPPNPAHPMAAQPTPTLVAPVEPAPTHVGLPAAASGTAPEAAPGRQPRRRKWLAVAAAAGLVLVVSTVLVLTADRPSKQSARTAGPATTTGTIAAAPAAAELEARAAEYYRLLPHDPDGAWAMLGPAMRARGRSQYEQSWKKTDSVEPASTRVEGDLVVVVELDRTGDDGRFRETHRLTFVQQSGTLLVDADEVVSSRRVGKDGDDDKGDEDKDKDKDEDEKGKGDKKGEGG